MQIACTHARLFGACPPQLAGDAPAMIYARAAHHLDRALARYRAFEARRFSRA